MTRGARDFVFKDSFPVSAPEPVVDRSRELAEANARRAARAELPRDPVEWWAMRKTRCYAHAYRTLPGGGYEANSVCKQSQTRKKRATGGMPRCEECARQVALETATAP